MPILLHAPSCGTHGQTLARHDPPAAAGFLRKATIAAPLASACSRVGRAARAARRAPLRAASDVAKRSIVRGRRAPASLRLPLSISARSVSRWRDQDARVPPIPPELIDGIARPTPGERIDDIFSGARARSPAAPISSPNQYGHRTAYWDEPEAPARSPAADRYGRDLRVRTYRPHSRRYGHWRAHRPPPPRPPRSRAPD